MPRIIPPRRARFALLAILAHAWIGTVRGQSPITASGRGVLKTSSPDVGESIGVEVQMKNGTNAPVRVARAEVFLSCQGGWSASMGEMIAKEKTFFGNPPVLDPGEYSYEFAYNYSTPISHYVLALQLARPGRPPHDTLLQVPLVRAGFPAPARLHASAPVFVGLQEPIEVLTLADGVSWLPIVGQVVNTSGRPLTLKKWHLLVKDGTGKAVLDRDLTSAYHIEASNASLNEFHFAFILPKEFRKGTLQIDAEVDLGGRRVPVTRPVDVERVEARAVRSPVEGRWDWSNGPGELTFHTHYHYPEQRYAYDLLVFGGGRRTTSSGDPNKNESYFCWDRPIHCVEDGRVTIVIDDVPDNFGRKPNPANNPSRNSCVVVEHAGGHFSIYTHVRKGGAAVKVGQAVKAGDVLGRVGNAGSSSEPHLHFDYLGLDRSGRFRSIPVRVEGLKAVDGKPADGGVPKGGVEYVSGAGK